MKQPKDQHYDYKKAYTIYLQVFVLFSDGSIYILCPVVPFKRYRLLDHEYSIRIIRDRLISLVFILQIFCPGKWVEVRFREDIFPNMES